MKVILGFFAAVVAVAALSSYCTLHWVAARQPAASVAAHDWLHKVLRVTARQHKALEPIEARFAEKERVLRDGCALRTMTPLPPSPNRAAIPQR